MNKMERIKAVKAMEFLARQLNDEEIFEKWLCGGVADADIEYGDLTVTCEDALSDFYDFYIEDKYFSELMDLFLRLMKAAAKSGGLYIDGVVSK